MLQSEAELMVRRSLEDTPGAPELTDEQIQFFAMMVMKIAGRMIEEAVSTMNAGRPGGKREFFS